MYTLHAEKRCQQRGVKQVIVGDFLSYGRCGQHKGANLFYMDNEALAENSGQKECLSDGE